MPKGKKSKKAKKHCSMSAKSTPLEQLAAPTGSNAPMYEDFTSSDESDNDATARTKMVEADNGPKLNNDQLAVLSPDSIDRIFPDNPKMAAEVGEGELTIEKRPPQFKQFLEIQTLGSAVTLNVGEEAEPENEGEVESQQIEDALEAIEAVEREAGSMEQLIRKKMNSDLGPSVMRTEIVEVISEVVEEPFGNGGFENSGNDQKGTKSALGKRHREEENQKEEEEISQGVRGRRMMVCQVMENGVLVVRLVKPDRLSRFVRISNDFEWEEPLRLGDIIEVSESERLEKRYADWISDALKINADAEAIEISAIFQNQVQHRTGIVMNAVVDEKTNVLKSVDVALPESEILQRIYSFQISAEIAAAQIKPGILVKVPFVRIEQPQSIAIGPKGMYILPAEFEEVSEKEVVAHQPCIGTGITELVQGYQFPFFPESIELSEQGIAAALSGSLLRAKIEMEEFTIDTRLFVLENGKNSVTVTFEHFVEEKRKFVNLTKVWEDDAAIQGKIKGSKKACCTGRIIEVNKCFSQGLYVLQAKLTLSLQLAKKYDAEKDFEHMCEGWEVSLIPWESFKALEKRVALFSSNVFSGLTNGNSDTCRIWQILTSVGEQSPPIASSEGPSCFDRHPALIKLAGEQRRTAELMLDNVPRVVAQQAPPGSGKTFTLAAIVAALLVDPEIKILCLAPLNVAVVKMAEELVGALRTEGCSEVPLALFSGTGKGRYREQLDRIAGNLLEAAATSEDFWKKLAQKEVKEVKQYLQHVKKRPRIAKEAKIAEYLLSLEGRRVICCTLSFAEQIGRLITDRNVVVLDEAGQGSFVQVCTTISELEVIRKVLITGDKYQLAVNMQATPEPVRSGFGFDTLLINLDSSPGVDKTTLQTNYRSHWQIVACVESSAYAPHGEVLHPGPGSFRMLIDHIKMPISDSPILLIHQESPMEAELTSFSATNSGQTRTVIELLGILGGFPGSIRIISLYAGQAAQIGRELKTNGMESLAISPTADSMQGQESDLVIVTTTVSGQQCLSNWHNKNNAKDRKSEFWGDAQRINVALSRGKHGLVIVGDLIGLGGSQIWSRFINKALEYTVAIAPAAIPLLQSQNSRYVRGQLVDGFGDPVQNFKFHSDWSQPCSSTVPSFIRSHAAVVSNRPLPSPRLQMSLPPQSVDNGASCSTQRQFVQSRPDVRCWRCDRLGHVSARCTYPPRRKN